MNRPIYAVLDTNVMVSALLTKNPQSPTVLVVEEIFYKHIVPVFNKEILDEYREVLYRKKFNFDSDTIETFLHSIEELGINTERSHFEGILPDPDDLVFYEVSLTGDSYLVTGNIKHFPTSAKVVTPAEMMIILSKTHDTNP